MVGQVVVQLLERHMVQATALWLLEEILVDREYLFVKCRSFLVVLQKLLVLYPDLDCAVEDHAVDFWVCLLVIPEQEVTQNHQE